MLQLMIRAGHHVMSMCCSRMPEGEKEQKDEIIMPVDHTEKGFEQAIEEGFILDVLQHYTTYKTYYKLAKAIEYTARD